MFFFIFFSTVVYHRILNIVPHVCTFYNVRLQHLLYEVIFPLLIPYYRLFLILHVLLCHCNGCMVIHYIENLYREVQLNLSMWDI